MLIEAGLAVMSMQGRAVEAVQSRARAGNCKEQEKSGKEAGAVVPRRRVMGNLPIQCPFASAV